MVMGWPQGDSGRRKEQRPEEKPEPHTGSPAHRVREQGHAGIHSQGQGPGLPLPRATQEARRSHSTPATVHLQATLCRASEK